MNSYFASFSKKQGHTDDYTFYTYSDLLNSTHHDDYTSSAPLSLTEFYNDKTVFCTGCTGFLGKVVVEKFLRCLPNIRKLYLLVREKKDRKTGKVIPPEERLITEILRSPIMDRIIKERFNGKREDFEVFAREKIEGVFGDVTEENIFVGSTLAKIEQLKKEIQVIIHSAATIGFTERLDYAINLNAYGPLRCLNFAKQCHNIEAFTHISTAYTNSNMKSGSRVDEKFYPLKLPGGEDIEAFCERIRKLSPKEIEKATTKALAFTGYPNTYTITKRIGEALVAKYKGDVNVAILRPTIVGAALRDPVPGWIDAVSAGGSVYLFSGLGIIHLLPGNTKVVSDQVPVDFVSNAMIICPADIATRKSSLRVYHCGTSTSNPGRWQDTVTGTLRYWHTHQPDKSVSRAEFNMITNRFFYKTQYLMRYTWMIQLYGLIATIFGSKAAVKAVEGFKKMASRQSNLSSNFHHFTLNEWFFDVANLDSAFHRLPEHEKDLFTLDWSLINWSTYFQYFCYGLHKFVLKENPEPPTTTDLIKSNEYNFINNLYNDVELAFTAAGRFTDGQTREQVKQTVLQSKIVQDAILSEAETLNISVMNVEKRALQIMDQMFADPNNNAIRAFGWILRKIWRRMYQSIMVDTNEIEKLKEISKKAESGTLVFIPTHRSYIDFLIVSYVFFVYGVPVPHIAAGEDFLNMFLVRDLFRYSGAFFMKRSFGSDNLYKAIFSEYVQRLLVDGNPVEFFVEGTRSRGGKTLRPKLGLLKTIADTYLDKRVDNLTLVPIHIGYEKVIESESHTRELLGGNKKGESLSALISASSVLLRKYGDIHVKIAEPISLKDYVENMKSQSPSFDPFSKDDDKNTLVKNLGTKITYDLNQSAVIMPIALVSTILLTYREGISMEELQSKTDWLKNQIISRGGNVYWSKTQTTASIVNRALGLINNIIKKNKNMLEPAIEVKSDYKKILELSYYRNQIIHMFFVESIISCSFYSFREKLMIDQGVSLSELLKRCEFLNELLSLEFIYKERPEEHDDFMTVINAMSKRGIFQIKDEKVFVPVLYLENLKFICSLLWPFIEAYWGASMALISLPFSGNEQELPTLKKKALVERMQWFIEKLYFDQKVHFYEACSSETLSNAVAIFDKMGILQTTTRVEKTASKKGAKETAPKSESVVSLLPPYNELDKLFEFVGELQQYRKTTPKTDKSALPNTEIPLRQPRL